MVSNDRPLTDFKFLLAVNSVYGIFKNIFCYKGDNIIKPIAAFTISRKNTTTMANDSLLKRVLKSIFFRQANSKAVRYARNSGSLLNLIRDALQKSGGLTGEKMQVFREQIGLLSRMLKSYASGQYRDIPWKTLVRMIAVLIYFVSPIDFIPDILPIVGISDDIALVVWLVSAIRDDIERFRVWEHTQAVAKNEIIPVG